MDEPKRSLRPHFWAYCYRGAGNRAYVGAAFVGAGLQILGFRPKVGFREQKDEQTLSKQAKILISPVEEFYYLVYSNGGEVIRWRANERENRRTLREG